MNDCSHAFWARTDNFAQRDCTRTCRREPIDARERWNGHGCACYFARLVRVDAFGVYAWSCQRRRQFSDELRAGIFATFMSGDIEPKSDDAVCIPDFLGIGGHRCGSSWLHTNLNAHPEIWLPPRKELHYFDRSPAYPSPSYLGEDRFFRRLFGQEPHQRSYRRRVLRMIGAHLLRPGRYPLNWDLKYHLGRPSDAWYLSLFKPGSGKTKGEITPAYSLLDSEDVGRVKALLPDVKILFLMRNPVERAWSSLRYDGLANSSVSAVASALESSGIAMRTDYVRTLAIWRKHFPADRIFTGFTDEVTHDPRGLLLRVFEFLGVDANEAHIPDSVKKKMNTSPEQDMDPAIKVMLTRRYLPLIEQLRDEFGGYAEEWWHEAQSTLRNG